MSMNGMERNKAMILFWKGMKQIGRQCTLSVKEMAWGEMTLSNVGKIIFYVPPNISAWNLLLQCANPPKVRGALSSRDNGFGMWLRWSEMAQSQKKFCVVSLRLKELIRHSAVGKGAKFGREILVEQYDIQTTAETEQGCEKAWKETSLTDRVWAKHLRRTSWHLRIRWKRVSTGVREIKPVPLWWVRYFEKKGTPKITGMRRGWGIAWRQALEIAGIRWAYVPNFWKSVELAMDGQSAGGQGTMVICRHDRWEPWRSKKSARQQCRKAVRWKDQNPNTDIGRYDDLNDSCQNKGRRA